MEKQGALCASLFVGFPHADIRNAGLSAVVVTDDDPALARTWCDELLDMAWSSREKWIYKAEPLAVSLARAKQMADRPVVLLDHYDNAASGGTMLFRKVESPSLGTKVNTQVWTLTVTATGTAA